MRAFIIRIFCYLMFLVVLSPDVFGQKEWIAPEKIVMEKNYAVLYFLYDNEMLREQLGKLEEFNQLHKARQKHHAASLTCESQECYIPYWKWQNAEVDQALEAIGKFFDKNPDAFNALFDREFFRYQYKNEGGDSRRTYLLNALRDDLNGVNWVIDVYGGGAKPNYPKIDSISYDVRSKRFAGVLKTLGQNTEREIRANSAYFFQPLLTAMRLLEVNERYDAAMMEPLELNENRVALEYIRTLDFDKFPYTATVTLGAGPSVYGQPISDIGMLNSREAARLYRQKLVPLIVVSGGRVHPYKTSIVEALEMKRYLMEILGIPEKAIIIEPHARHTTTNLRNASRLLLKYGIPEKKWALINSTESHINAVEVIEKRFMRELGLVPVELGKRLDELLIEFRPLKESFRIDHEEMLDP